MSLVLSKNQDDTFLCVLDCFSVKDFASFLIDDILLDALPSRHTMDKQPEGTFKIGYKLLLAHSVQYGSLQLDIRSKKM